MESVGARLKKIRLEKGISLEDVHKRTKIHMNILNAIEEDRIVNISPVYIKGFLKIYCNLLGVDFREYVPEYKEPQATMKPPFKTQDLAFAAKKEPLKLPALKVDLKKMRVGAVAVIGSILLFWGIFNIGKAISSKIKLAKPVKKQRVVTSAPAVNVETKKEAAAPVEQEPENKIPISNIIRLGMRAREDCWIQLKADGKTVFQNILKKGRAESWQAKEKIELSLGNAAGVDLEINGKIISSLGKRGQPAKHVIITREGLEIRR